MSQTYNENSIRTRNLIYPEGWTEVQIQQFQDEVNNYRKEININENNK